MKNIALVILLIAGAVLAGLYLNQSGKVIEARAEAESLRQQAGEREAERARARAELEKARAEAAAKDREIAQLSAASASNASPRPGATGASPGQTAPKPSNPLSTIAKMFEDPEMKDAIAAQQKAALGSMIDKTYGKLFSDLGLTPEQTTALKEMLLNKQLAGAQVGMSILSDSDASKAAEALGQKVKAAGEAADAEIKAFLGDEKFAQLKDYEKSAPDRMAISGFKDQLNASAALTPDQEQQLIEAMTLERKNFKFTTDLSDRSNLVGNFSAMFNEENVNRFVQEMDQLNQHFIGHAQNILAPDQLESFQKYLNQQHALQKAGMQMGAKMFAPSK